MLLWVYATIRGCEELGKSIYQNETSNFIILTLFVETEFISTVNHMGRKKQQIKYEAVEEGLE